MKTLKETVLLTIRSKALRPTELLEKLSDLSHPRNTEATLSELIETGTVEFGVDGLLREVAT